MQVQATIQLLGDAEEVTEALASITSVLKGEDLTDLPVDAAAWWTSERADELVRRITDYARQALAVICENAPAVSFDIVLNALGMSGESTGGVMASIGFAIRKMEAPNFLARNYSTRTYYIDPAVAEVMLTALRRCSN